MIIVLDYEGIRLKLVRPTYLIIICAIFIIIFTNTVFFQNLLKAFPLNSENTLFLISVVLVYYILLVIIFSLFSFRKTLKPFLILMLIISATVHYFMESYHIAVDKAMIENVMQTNAKEIDDLLTFKFFITLFFLALLPSYIIYRIPLIYTGFRREFIRRIRFILIHLLVLIVLLFTFSKFYTSFFREHKELRLYTNPLATLYNGIDYTFEKILSRTIPMKVIGEDAHISKNEESKRNIVIMVVGEAARADHFSLNGYEKNTNPYLAKEDVVNFSQMYACGTTTAISVPCMFSMYTSEEYDSVKGWHTHSVLDVLSRAGVDVLWRENNSDSKGVATRVPFEYYKTDFYNRVCDDECRDEGMLIGLDKVIEKSEKDIIIVLHQMGNHGPAYYKRYPKEFKHFTPVCETNQFESCTIEEIHNAYDNALRYTDYFLSKTIELLKRYEESANTTMIYMADHGESLGENGLYLHGLPNFIAPESQTHVGALMWFGKNNTIDKETLKTKAQNPYSHDYLFSTLLGLFSVKTKVYNPSLDMLRE
ncbi:MAG: Phosphoethanolamine transferase [uncultured Sulfurovum sp.]|uniref:Phosphoethanolamine transferase n=1 Tax=uncultured Sulfurovum sp. TaxID=269237 RepID=A0A6S6S5C4_9BACT|nr:MAG: Phosphoethanolamine transferase [uncultured Sulfurovum sp.]